MGGTVILEGLAVIGEVGIGLAGFSGVLIVLRRPGGGFSAPERFRVKVLVYSSLGSVLFAIVPFAVLPMVAVE